MGPQNLKGIVMEVVDDLMDLFGGYHYRHSFTTLDIYNTYSKEIVIFSLPSGNSQTNDIFCLLRVC
jgi:hypothetical protein